MEIESSGFGFNHTVRNGGLIINNSLTINAVNGMYFVGMDYDTEIIIASGASVIITAMGSGLWREGCKGRFIVEGSVNITTTVSGCGLYLCNNEAQYEESVTTIAENGIIEISSEDRAVYISGCKMSRTDVGIAINGKLIINTGSVAIYDSMIGTGCISVLGGDCMPIS